MEWAELILEYVKALVWPAALVVLALVFRQPLRNLIDGVSEVTAPGNISFKRRVTAVKADAEDASEETLVKVGAGVDASQGQSTNLGDLEEYRATSATDPVGAISGAWRAVRKVVRDVTRRLGTDRELPPGAYTSAHVRTLVPLGLSEEFVDVSRQLSSLRNDIVHGRRVRTDRETALSYLAAASDLLAAVRAVEESRGTHS